MRKVIVWMCGILLSINVAYAVTGVARFGSQHIDAYGIWMLKAKAVQLEQGMPLQMLRNPDYGYSHQTYPLLLPWLLSWGNWTLWLYPMVYGVILLLMYRIMRNEGQSHLPALMWTAAASFMGPLIAQGGRFHVGLADIWITLLVAICVLATQRKQPWLIVAAVIAASQIKTEGILLLAFLIGFRKYSWKYILVALVPFVGWQIAVRQWGISSDVTFGWPGFALIFHRLWIVLAGVGREMMNWRNWYVIWPLWWITGIRYRRVPYGRVLGLMVMGYVAVYVLADMDTAAYVASSVDRIMLQLLPLWWLGLVKRRHLEHG